MWGLLLILSGVHGDEYESMAAAVRLIKMIPKKLTHGTVAIVSVEITRLL